MVLKGVMDKNQQKSESRKYSILSQPRNLTVFENEIFQGFSYLYGLKVPKVGLGDNQHGEVPVRF